MYIKGIYSNNNIRYINKKGVTIILVIIENRQLLSKIISSFDKSKVKYTTNPSDDYQYLLVAELNQRIIKKIKENIADNKKIIFLIYLEEYKIHKYHNSKSLQAIKYNNLLLSVLSKCYLVITSLPFFRDYLNKKIKTKTVVIQKENPRLIELKKLRMLKNTCLFIDYNYTQLINIFDFANNYPKIKFQLLGYVPDYLLSSKQINIIHNLPRNIELIKSCDLIEYLALIRKNNIIVYCEDDIRNFNHLLYIILTKRKLLIKNSTLYNKYFINSKNMYLYNDSKDIITKLKKILNNSVSNISTDAYLLIRDNKQGKFGKIFKKN